MPCTVCGPGFRIYLRLPVPSRSRGTGQGMSKKKPTSPDGLMMRCFASTGSSRYATHFVRSGQTTTLELDAGDCSESCRTISNTTTPVSIDLRIAHFHTVGWRTLWSYQLSLRSTCYA